MSQTFFRIGIVIFIACLVMHILPLFSKRRSLFGYIGISLHTLMLIALFLGGAELSLVLLLYMASVMVYSAVCYLMSRRERTDDI